MTYRRELERLVCEVGFSFQSAPPGRRPEPHQMQEAVEGLVDEGVVSQCSVMINGTPYRFYLFAGADPRTQAAVLHRKTAAVEVFDQVDRLRAASGWHAEQIHHAALLAASDRWSSVGWWPGQRVQAIGGRTLTKERGGDIDLAGHHWATRVPFVAQVKNGREWIYPPNSDMWDLLGAAAQLHALPIFIARRFPERTFTFMKLVGGFAFRATKMILPPGTDSPSLRAALTELGFLADVDFIEEPLPRHLALWAGPINDAVGDAFARFQRSIDPILHLAFDEQLRKDRPRGRESRRHRRELVEEFIAQVGDREREEAGEAVRKATKVAQQVRLREKVREAGRKLREPRAQHAAEGSREEGFRSAEAVPGWPEDKEIQIPPDRSEPDPAEGSP